MGCGNRAGDPKGGCGGGAVGGGGTELASELTSSEAGGDGVPREKSSVSDHARRRACSNFEISSLSCSSSLPEYLYYYAPFANWNIGNNGCGSKYALLYTDTASDDPWMRNREL